MADNNTKSVESEDQAKRKRRDLSSTSELELSTIDEDNSKKQKKKKPKTNKNTVNNGDVGNEAEGDDCSSLMKQIKLINTKLENLDGSMKKVNDKLGTVMVKGGGSLREAMKDLLLEMKDHFLDSVNRSIDILESKLFDKDLENDALKEKIAQLEEKVKENETEQTKLHTQLTEIDEARKKHENEAEQYSRRNNIKISGILDYNRNETTLETAHKVIDLVRRNKLCNIHLHDIDIAHRLPSKNSNNRIIIVKLHSRYAKDEILRNVKRLKGTGIFINEDLTRINLHVLMCIKKKSPDEVESAWSRNGSIYYKDKQNKINFVPYEEYQDWIDLPLPAQTAGSKDEQNTTNTTPDVNVE